MERCVRSHDYAGCRELFAADVVGFGTRAVVAEGLDALEREQWRHVWPRIAEFTFVVDELRCRSRDGLTVVHVPFRSQADEGRGGPRPGRATIFLEDRDGTLRAVHTHFSLDPS